MAKCIKDGDPSGTSFHGTIIRTTPNTLRALFPDGDQGESGDGKCQMDYVCETESGEIFTIYDWKYYRPLGDDELVDFHIGGHNGRVTNEALYELEEMIEDLDSTGLYYTGRS